MDCADKEFPSNFDVLPYEYPLSNTAFSKNLVLNSGALYHAKDFAPTIGSVDGKSTVY